MQCPFCSASLEISDECAGQEATCAVCNEKIYADTPEYPQHPVPQEAAIDHVAPALFKQFVSIEDSMKAVQGKIASQVWTCEGLILGGIGLMVLSGFLFKANRIGALLMLVGVVLYGIIYGISCGQYWAVYKIACWRTAAINSSIPVVYAADPKQAPRRIGLSFFD